MSIFARLKKRAAFPVGDTGLHIRELTFRQVENVQTLEDPELKTWLTLAYCMVSAAGEREYPDAGSVGQLRNWPEPSRRMPLNISRRAS